MPSKVTNWGGSACVVPGYGVLLEPGAGVVLPDEPLVAGARMGGASRALRLEATRDILPGLVAVAPVFSPAASAGGIDCDRMAPVVALHVVFPPGVGGAADDVTIYSGNAPFTFEILDVIVFVTVRRAGARVTLRDAPGGGGSALSSDLSTSSLGKVRDDGSASPVVPKGGSVYLRRTDNRAGGEVVVVARK